MKKRKNEIIDLEEEEGEKNHIVSFDALTVNPPPPPSLFLTRARVSNKIND